MKSVSMVIYSMFVMLYTYCYHMMYAKHIPLPMFLCLCFIGLLPLCKKEWWRPLLPALFLLAAGLNAVMIFTHFGEMRNGALYFLKHCGNFRPSHLLYICFLLVAAMIYGREGVDREKQRTISYILYAITLWLMSKTAFSPEMVVLILSLIIFTAVTKAWADLPLALTPFILIIIPSLYRIKKFGRFDAIFLEEKRQILQGVALFHKTGEMNRTNPFCGMPILLVEEGGLISLVLVVLLALFFVILAIRTAYRSDVSKGQQNICLMIGIHILVELILGVTELIHPLVVPLLPIFEYDSLMMSFTYFVELSIVLFCRIHCLKRDKMHKLGTIQNTDHG